MAQGMNTFYACECLSAGDKRVKYARSTSVPPPTHTASYQRLSNRTYFKMIATHRYSPSIKGGTCSYHAVILTSKYGTPTSYSSIHVYAIVFPAGLNGLQVD